MEHTRCNWFRLSRRTFFYPSNCTQIVTQIIYNIMVISSIRLNETTPGLMSPVYYGGWRRGGSGPPPTSRLCRGSSRVYNIIVPKRCNLTSVSLRIMGPSGGGKSRCGPPRPSHPRVLIRIYAYKICSCNRETSASIKTVLNVKRNKDKRRTIFTSFFFFFVFSAITSLQPPVCSLAPAVFCRGGRRLSRVGFNIAVSEEVRRTFCRVYYYYILELCTSLSRKSRP